MRQRHIPGIPDNPPRDFAWWKAYIMRIIRGNERCRRCNSRWHRFCWDSLEGKRLGVHR